MESVALRGNRSGHQATGKSGKPCSPSELSCPCGWRSCSVNKIRDRWRFVAESWFALSAEDQMEALAVTTAESGWPAFLLEKDIWVVWALQILGRDQQLLQSLTFKGGTSLLQGPWVD